MATTNEIYSLYLAYFGRPPDAVGFAAAQSKSVAQLQSEFSASAESSALLASTNLATQVNNIYVNAFGRSAETAGLLYWVGEIAANRVTLSQAAFTIVSSALNDDRTTVTNKITAATAFYAQVVASPANIIGYSGNAASAQARTFLSSVTSSAATVTAAVAGVAAAVTSTVAAGSAAAVTPGSTFTLTTSTDSGTSFTGTAGNDNFNSAYIGDFATGTTLTPGDNLNGGAGTDTLNIAISGTITTGTAETINALSLTGIERVLVSNFDLQETALGDDHVIDMSAASGVTTVGMSSSAATGDTTFNNVANLVDAELTGGGDLAIVYQSTLLSGLSDSVKLTVTSAGTSTAPADFLAWNGAATGVAETLNVVSSGATNYITINANNDHKTINVSGDKELRITSTLDTTVTKVDASTSTGGVQVTAGVSNIAITGGSGNDTITMAGTLTTADTIDGGAGTDTLSISAPGTLVADLKVSNIERVRLAATDATAYDLSFLSGYTTVDFRSNGNAAISSSNVAEGTGVVISADNTNTITHGVKDAANVGTTNTVTVTLDHGTDETDVDVGTLSLGGIETVSIVSSGVTSNDTTAAVFAADVATSNSIATLTAGAAATINVSGATDLVLGATGSTVTANTAVNATNFTGRLVYTNRSTATAATTITGGSNDDFITGRNGLDNITGGAGNDSLVGGGGNDTISGGAGNDTITTTGASQDVLSGGDGNDSMNSAGGNDSIDAGAGDDVVTINTSATFTDDLTSADTLVGGAGNDSIAFANVGSTTLNFTTTAGQNALSNVSGFERIDLAAGAAQTITINDLTASAFGNNVTIRATTDQAHVATAAAVLSSTSTVNFTNNLTTATNALTYTLGNAKDNVQMGTRATNDLITVSNVAFLSSGDTINGGGGTTDTLSFTDTTGATYSTATAGNGLTNVSGVELIQVTTGGAGNYSFTLTDAFAAANVNTDSRITVSTTNGTGTLVVNASALTASYGLLSTQASSGAATLTGGAGNDSLTGGAAVDSLTGNGGDDTIVGLAGSDVISGGDGNDSITGGDGADVLTGGAGNDSFVVGSATQVGNEIVDFNAGTSSSTGSVDILQFDVTGSGETGAFASGTADAALVSSSAAGAAAAVAAAGTVVITTITSAFTDAGTLTAGTNIIAFDATTGLTSASAIQTAIQAAGAYTITYAGAASTGLLIALYDKGSDLGVAIIDLDAGSTTTDASTVTEVFTLTGVTSLANINAADFAFV